MHEIDLYIMETLHSEYKVHHGIYTCMHLTAVGLILVFQCASLRSYNDSDRDSPTLHEFTLKI